MASVLFLAAPLTVVVAVLVWRFADTTANVVLLHAWLARVATLVGLLVGIASLWFGALGVRFAKRHRQPSAISVAGLLLGSAATLSWIIAGIGLLNTTESLLLIYGPK